MELEPSPPQAEDLQFLYLGRPVLVVGPELAEALGDQTLDVRRADGGAELVLR